MLISATWLAIAATAFAQVKPEFTKDAPDAKDHPMLKRIQGSVILRFATKKFDSYQIAMERVVWDSSAQKYNGWKKITVEGAHTTLFYREPKDASTFECIRAYQEELKEKGFEVMFEGSSGGNPLGDNNSLDNGRGYFLQQVYQTEKGYSLQGNIMDGADDYRYTALKKPAEGSTGEDYVTVFCAATTDTWKDPDKGLLAGTVVARVDLVETKAMQKRMVLVKAAEMDQQITTTGRVALYGIYFDFNQATLKPESDSTLQEIQHLMNSDPNLKLLVVGHTDNVGTFEFNRDLSSRRAAAVVDALGRRFAISSQRLFAFGCSFASPAAPNTSEESRAKNRRVELVRWN
jgi:OOP family OmpA-OmpF porin